MRIIDKRQNGTVLLGKLCLGSTFTFDDEDALCVVVQNPYNRQDVVHYVDLESNEIRYASEETAVIPR
jgi:hypothetical protein